MNRKVYVEVAAVFSPEGQILPRRIRWEDGTVFTVDRVTDIRRAAATKAGGCGLRYTIRIGGRQTYLFLDEDRWFVEANDAKRPTA
ncbi:MAG: hypothetical protein IJN04_05315 [Clostridia bacterium]|nr:hypothetical protein [Clostridia bacterium]